MRSNIAIVSNAYSMCADQWTTTSQDTPIRYDRHHLRHIQWWAVRFSDFVFWNEKETRKKCMFISLESWRSRKEKVRWAHRNDHNYYYRLLDFRSTRCSTLNFVFCVADPHIKLWHVRLPCTRTPSVMPYICMMPITGFRFGEKRKLNGTKI